MANLNTTYTVKVLATGSEELTRINKAVATQQRLAIQAGNLQLRQQKAAREVAAAMAAEATQITRVNTARQQSATGLASFTGGLTRLSRASRETQNAVRNVGYQISDVAVMMGSGAGAARALGQQLPQMVSGFGLWGTAIGTVLAVAIPLFASLKKAEADFEAVATATDALVTATDDLYSAYRRANQALEDFDAMTGLGARNLKTYAQALLAIKQAQTENTLAAATTEATNQFNELQEGMDKLTEARRKFDAEMAGPATPSRDIRLTELSEDIAEVTGYFGMMDHQLAELAPQMERLGKALGEGGTAEEVNEIVQGIVRWNEANKTLTNEQLQFLANTVIIKREQERIVDIQRRVTYEASLSVGQMDRLATAAAAAATNAARIASAIAQVNSQAASLDLSTAGLDAQTDALERGASAIEARAEGQKKMLELQLAADIEGAQTISQINAASDAYERQVAAIDDNARAQQRQLDVTEKLNTANAPSGGGGGGAAGAAERTATASRDASRGIDELNSSLERYMTAAERAAIESAKLTAQVNALGGEGSLDPKQLELYHRALAQLNAEAKQTESTLTDMGQALEDAIGSGLNTLFDDLISGSKSAGEAFSDMLVGMANDIAKFLFQQQVNNFLKLLLGGGGGSPINFTQPANYNAPISRAMSATPTGATRMTTGIVTPALPIPPATASARAAKATSTTVNVYGAPAGTEVEESISPNGERQIDVYIRGAVKGMIGDGSLDKQMRTSYGIRRRAG